MVYVKVTDSVSTMSSLLINTQKKIFMCYCFSFLVPI